MEQMLITHRNAGQNVLTHEVLSEVYDLTYRLNNIQATLNGEPVGTLLPPCRRNAARWTAPHHQGCWVVGERSVAGFVLGAGVQRLVLRQLCTGLLADEQDLPRTHYTGTLLPERRGG